MPRYFQRKFELPMTYTRLPVPALTEDLKVDTSFGAGPSSTRQTHSSVNDLESSPQSHFTQTQAGFFPNGPYHSVGTFPSPGALPGHYSPNGYGYNNIPPFSSHPPQSTPIYIHSNPQFIQYNYPGSNSETNTKGSFNVEHTAISDEARREEPEVLSKTSPTPGPRKKKASAIEANGEGTIANVNKFKKEEMLASSSVHGRNMPTDVEAGDPPVLSPQPIDETLFSGDYITTIDVRNLGSKSTPHKLQSNSAEHSDQIISVATPVSGVMRSAEGDQLSLQNLSLNDKPVELEGRSETRAEKTILSRKKHDPSSASFVQQSKKRDNGPKANVNPAMPYFSKKAGQAKSPATGTLSLMSTLLTTLFPGIHESYSLLRPLVKIPVAFGERLNKEVKAYMNAELKSMEIVSNRPQLHALWEPIATGMEIGDVGSFDSTGTFIPLLNITLSQEENETERFGGFSLEGQSFEKLDYQLPSQTSKLKAGIRLQDASNKFRFLIDSEHRLKIVKGTTRGAALILSGPGIRSDVTGVLRNHDGYFASQAVKWYHYAKDRGWTAKNGALVLITACFLVESWGYATYRGEPTLKDINATFAARKGGGYDWEFPPGLDMQGLSIRRHSCGPNISTELQCVAFKAFSIHCEDEVWKREFKS